MMMHVRHPLIAVWWAMSFAGFGQMMVGSYVKGYVLVLLEIIINMQAKLNLAIVYSFTGQFELAKEAVGYKVAFRLCSRLLKTMEAAEVLIAATFDCSLFVELAITELEEKGIAKDKILAIPLAQKEQDFAILDTIHRSDGISIFDTASIFATAGMTL